MCSTRYSYDILMKLEYCRQIFERKVNMKFHQNPSSGGRVVLYGRTGITKLVDSFRNFANQPKIIFCL